MVSGLTLLAAAVLAAPASTPEVQGVCDGSALADDGSDGAADPAAPGANCSEPPPAGPVVECSDRRMSFWAQEIGGTCAEPAQLLGPVAARARGRAATLCTAANCANDPPPLRAARADADGPPSAIPTRLPIDPILGRSPLGEEVEATPRSPAPSRIERPPRA